MRVVAGFHTRDDEWILPKKLEVCSQFCEAIIVCMDRPSPETREILRRFPKVTAFEHKNTLGLPDSDPIRGPLCEEGAMRQEVLDRALKLRPDYLYLGDTDEIPTPEVVDFFPWAARKYGDIEFFRFDIVNLYQSEDQYISGKNCIWSPEHPGSNKRTAIIRLVPGKSYSYDVTKACHVPLEPLGVKGGILFSSPKILHYKFTNWERWERSIKAGMKKYQDYWKGLEVSATPSPWLWRNP